MSGLGSLLATHPVLGVYLAGALLAISLAVYYLTVASAKSFAISRKNEATSFHWYSLLFFVFLAITMILSLGVFVSAAALLSLPLSLALFGLVLRGADVKPEPLEYVESVDKPFKYECVKKLSLNPFVNPYEGGKSAIMNKLKELIARGDKKSIFVRYALTSPVAVLVAVSLYPVLGPLALFAMGYSLQGFSALIGAILGWGGFVAAIEGEMGPLVRAKLIMEKLRTYLHLYNITFGEALTVYLLMVFALSGFTAYSFFLKKMKNLGIEIMSLFIPLIAYAMCENRFGEPLAVLSLALGATLSLKFKGLEASKLMDKVASVLGRIGRIVVYYDIPLKPYLYLAVITYFFLVLIWCRDEGVKPGDLIEMLKSV